MSWIVGKMKWIMLVAGALTFTMVQAAVAPRAALGSMFGEDLSEQAGAAVTVDSVMVLLFSAYLIGAPRARAAA